MSGSSTDVAELASELAALRKALAELAIIQAETLNALVDLGSRVRSDGFGLPGRALVDALIGHDPAAQRQRLLDISERSLELATRLVDAHGG